MTLIRGLTGEHAVVIIVVLALACSMLLLVTWMVSPLGYGPMLVGSLRVELVQFGVGHLDVTVMNDGDYSTIVTGVIVNQIQTRTLPFMSQGHNVTVDEILPGTTVVVNEPIPKGEHRLIVVSYEWTSGSRYAIGLTSEDGGYYFYHPEVYSAPTPPENPFNHPFWHRPSFAYEYW
jgi:hypothetical protein